jgi:cytochrome P450
LDILHLTIEDRLLQYWSPKALRGVVGTILYPFLKPRETPLAEKFVLDIAHKPNAAPFTVVRSLKEKDKRHQLNVIDIAAECLDHIAAGMDSTGDILCFLMWELSQPPSFHYQERLRQELGEKPDARFDELPFLDALVMEGMRCFPGVPMSLPRYVPSGGRSINGYYLPEGTVVSCQAFSLHRLNPDVFPDPDVFYPERWLSNDGSMDRNRWFFAFANGGTGYIGKQ